MRAKIDVSCNSSDPTVQAMSDQIGFDWLNSPGPVIESIRSVPPRWAQIGPQAMMLTIGSDPFSGHLVMLLHRPTKRKHK